MRGQGEKNSQVKITARQAEEIFWSMGRQVDVAKKYGISQSQVSKIKNKYKWGYTREKV